MKLLLLTISLLLAGAQQPPPEPYPGQKNHDEPPKDWMCQRPAPDRIGKADAAEASHWCSCERMWDDALQWMHNDTQCLTACHENHCTCPVAGATPRMPGYKGAHAGEPNPFQTPLP